MKWQRKIAVTLRMMRRKRRHIRGMMLAEFMDLEAIGGIALLFATIAAMICANILSPEAYYQFTHLQFTVQLGEAGLSKPLLLWVNDGLMALFFLMVGLELKRETVDGHLSDGKTIVLPLVAAAGGILVPALLYVFYNWPDSMALRGWAIPAATDIAFALGVLALLGRKTVPTSLKVFLMSLAIIDDLAAILVIALFYTSQLSLGSMFFAGLCVLMLFILNRMQVIEPVAYVLVGLCLWLAVLKSGVHATLAGVMLAIFIPYKAETRLGFVSPAKEMEHALLPWVSFLVLPLFAFCNAGVVIGNVTWDMLASGVSLGIITGLFFGKQIGVFLFSWFLIRFRFVDMPKDANWLQLYGVAVLCGIGFTMSLFIGKLAFPPGSVYDEIDNAAILIASGLSVVLGALVLLIAQRRKVIAGGG